MPRQRKRPNIAGCTAFVPLRHGAWRAMEEAYDAGKLRAIGVSNFDPIRLIDLCAFARIEPMVDQVETHPFWQQEPAHEVMADFGVVHEAWGRSPKALGASSITRCFGRSPMPMAIPHPG